MIRVSKFSFGKWIDDYYQLLIYAGWACLITTAATGLATTLAMLVVLPPRADESFTLIQASDIGYWQMLVALRQGHDAPYLHTSLIWLLFYVFGQSLFVQRIVSLLFWLTSGIFIFLIFRFTKLHVLIATSCTVSVLLSQSARFFAYDGRSYSLIFLFAVILIYFLVLSLYKGRLNGFVIFILSLMGLFVHPVFILCNCAVGMSFLVLYLIEKRTIWRKFFVATFLFSTMALLVYTFVAFGVSSLISDRMQTQSRLLSWDDGIGYIARWNAWPNIPGVPSWIERASVIIIAYFVLIRSVAYSYPRWKDPENYRYTNFLLVLGCSCITIIVCVIVIGQFVPIAVLPDRYFAAISFGVSMIFAGIFVDVKLRGVSLIIYVVFIVGLFLDGLGYLTGVRDALSLKNNFDKVAATVFAPGDKFGDRPPVIIIAEGGENEARFFGQLYILFPDQRDRMIFLLPNYWRGSNWLTAIADYYPKSRYFFRSSIPTQTIESAKVIMIGNKQKIPASIARIDLGWEDNVMIDGRDWLRGSE